MFYRHLILFNLFFGFFGFWKPFKNASKNKYFGIWRKIWPVFIILSMIANYFTTVNSIDFFDIKSNLNQFSFLNQVICNVGIIFIEMINSQNVCTILYQTVNKCFQSFQVGERNLKNLSCKLYFWFSIPTIIFIGTVIWEVSTSLQPPFILLTKVPSFLTIFHLVINLYLILSILKLVNKCLSRSLLFCDDLRIVEKPAESKVAVFYFLNINESFIDNDQVNQRFDVQCLCRIYDDLGTCIKLLEKYHGFQILLGIWLMFSNAVAGIPMVTCKQAKSPGVVVNNVGLSFLWFIMACYVQDQIQQEVEITDNLIIKHLIDFRCDQPRKSMLQSFKQLVGTERLKFTACSLFELSYSMIVGTILNIITYSIILIQLV